VRSDRERLRDILEAVEKVAARVERGRGEFEGNEDLQLALTRLIEIVGEAAAGLSPELRAQYPDVPWCAIASMRNRIIHGYFDMDRDILWNTAARDIPVLAERVTEMILGSGSNIR
jgi:uncharacterized protein with HEPN domain